MNGLVVHGRTAREITAMWSSIAAKQGLEMQVGEGWDSPWPCTAFVDASPTNAGGIPWDMLGLGFGLLAHWDVMVPLGREGTVVQEIGTESECRRAQEVAGDLRQPVYAPEVVLVGEGGRAWLECWREECRHYSDERMAFTVALHRCMPRVCTLPRSWLVRGEERDQADRKWSGNRKAVVLVQVEVAPGRFVRCRSGEEALTRKAFAGRSRAERRAANGGR